MDTFYNSQFQNAGRTSKDLGMKPEIVNDMKVQAREMVYKEAVKYLGSIEAQIYYNSIKSPGMQDNNVNNVRLTAFTVYHT